MIAAFVVAVIALVVFGVVELWGIFDPGYEDTFSEWVWDTYPVLRWLITVASAAVGGIAVWSAGHYLEGNARRRRKEERNNGH